MRNRWLRGVAEPAWGLTAAKLQNGCPPGLPALVRKPLNPVLSWQRSAWGSHVRKNTGGFHGAISNGAVTSCPKTCNHISKQSKLGAQRAASWSMDTHFLVWNSCFCLSFRTAAVTWPPSWKMNNLSLPLCLYLPRANLFSLFQRNKYHVWNVFIKQYKGVYCWMRKI